MSVVELTDEQKEKNEKSMAILAKASSLATLDTFGRREATAPCLNCKKDVSLAEGDGRYWYPMKGYIHVGCL